MLYLITALLCTFPGSHWQLPRNSNCQINAPPRSLLAVSVAEPVNSIADDRNAPDRRQQSIFYMLLNADEVVQDSATQTNGNAVGSDLDIAAPANELAADTSDLIRSSTQDRKIADQRPAPSLRSGGSDRARFGIAILMFLGLAVAFIMIATGMIRLLR